MNEYEHLPETRITNKNLALEIAHAENKIFNLARTAEEEGRVMEALELFEMRVVFGDLDGREEYKSYIVREEDRIIRDGEEEGDFRRITNLRKDL